MYTEAEKWIKEASYKELKQKILYDLPWARENRDAVIDALSDLAWDIGDLWDRIEGTDPEKGRKPHTLGTPNHRSMTYKFRKLAGYSYP